PLRGASARLGDVEPRVLPVRDEVFAGDPYVAHVLTRCSVNQMRDRIEDGLQRRIAHRYADHVGRLARLERADLVLEPEGTRAVDRGHPQGGCRRHGRRTVRGELAESGWRSE